jgi:hypothetical protein
MIPVGFSTLISKRHCAYAMVNLATGRGETIPDWIVAKYSI